MERKNFSRFLILALTIALVILFTVLNLPNVPLLTCSSSTSSPICHRLYLRRYPTKHRTHSSDTLHHPLDPLTEFNTLLFILTSYTPFKSVPLTLHSAVLEEPPKPSVLAWRLGDPLPTRKASVVARVGSTSHIITVDLDKQKVIRDEPGPSSGYPTMTIDDMVAATYAPLTSAEFNSTVIKRGVDLANLACLPLSTGWYGREEENQRLIKVQCYTSKGTANFYMRPIKGLTVLVDLDTNKVVEVSDNGKDISIPKAAGTDYRFSAIKNEMRLVNPISIEQPNGPSFSVDNHLVKWANWDFH